MNKYYFLPIILLTLSCSLPSLAQTDTVINIEEINEWKVVGQNVVDYAHRENEFNFSFPFMKAKKGNTCYNSECRWDITAGLIGLGWNSTIDQVSGLQQRGSHSIDFFMGHILAWRLKTGRNTPSFTLGAGIDFRNWTTREGLYQQAHKDSEAVEWVTAPEGAERVGSRIYTFSIMIPLTIRQRLTHGFMLTAGASLDLTTHASVHSSYYLNNVKYSSSWDRLRHETIGMSVIGSLQWQDVGVFARYTPTSPIKKGYGPEFKTMTVGIAIGW